jgi:hypothetical protein
MFSLTPPPSEFDEVDKSNLLTCSPNLSGFCYPSPASSHSPRHQTSLSSDSLSLSHDDISDLSSYPDCHPSDPGSDMFYSYSSAEPTFLPLASSMPVEQDMPPFTNSNYPPVSQQSAWIPYSTYPQQPSISTYDSNTTSTYPPFDTSMPATFTNIIPPTPQGLTPATFDFNSLPRPTTTQQPHHLTASPAFSTHSSQHSSLTSLSRSPSPALYSMPLSHTHHSGPTRSTLRSNSTSSSTSSLHAYGIPVTDPHTSQPAWRCAYPGCTSRATFTRGCDLRKHYNRHSKHLFCRVEGCPQSQQAAAARSTDGTLSGGFSSKKDRARHEAKHNPGIKCEWKGHGGEECGRVFSRMDNMKDHVRRIHRKGEGKVSR